MTAEGAGALPADLVAWIEEHGGGRVTRADRQPGGARKEAWFVDVALADGDEHELFLRYDRSDPAATADPWTLHREATVYVALQGTDVRVPRVHAVHPVHQAMLSERLEGENWFSRITDPDERTRTAQDFMVQLATLHRLDPAQLDLPAFPTPTTVRDAVHHELHELHGILEQRGGTPDPALVFALDWLQRNVPAYDGPVVLVQGDTGPGNFMYADGRVVAVVDWELAHLGDPMDDIAWLSLRATQEPFPDFPARLREYAERSGYAIDDDRVHYYRVLAETKLQVMTHRGDDLGSSSSGSGTGANTDVGNTMIYGMLHRRLWLEALAAAQGFTLTGGEDPPPQPRRDHDRLYGAVLAQLRDVIVPRTTDPLARVRAKGVARIVKYLEQVNTYGAFYDACELDDLGELLGDRPASIAVGRAAAADAVREQKLSDDEYLGYLGRRIARETALARPAMGALADRHWPELH